MTRYHIDDLKLEGKDEYLFRSDIEGTTLRDKKASKRQEEKETAELLRRPDAEGEFESLGEDAGPHLVANLHLSDRMHKTIDNLDVYKAGYNSYAIPMREVLGQMGRLKDLQRTGAPMTPEALRDDKRLSRRFRKLSLTRKSDADEQMAANQWIKRQTDAEVHFVDYMSSVAMLGSAVEGFRKAQMMLEKRSLALEHASKINEKAKIDQAAETLVKIVEFSTEAWNAVDYIDKFAEMTWTPKDTSGEHYDSKGKRSTPDVRSGGNRSVRKMEGMYSRYKAINEHELAKRAKSASGLSLKDVFILAMGDAGKYEQLQAEIAKLESQMQDLELQIEMQEIATAKSMLGSFTMNMQAKKLAVESDEAQSRMGAQVFSQAMGGGDKGLMSMYSAEAYQRIDLYGDQAESMRGSAVDPWVGGVYGLLAKGPDWFDARNLNSDYARLKDNYFGVKGQKGLLKENLPTWKGRARAWRAFFEDVTEKDLVSTPEKMNES